MTKIYCSKCVMNTLVDENIFFDQSGLCNHCVTFNSSLSSRTSKSHHFEKIVKDIKKKGKNRKYDCIIGVSGGVDSSYLAYLAKHKYGLNPLAIHFDNGWNSELAVKNIEKLLSKLDIDLYTYVIDWNEFKDLQRSFLKASVPDGEVPTDHAINALLWSEASKRGIKYILNGMNFMTESTMLDNWSYGHADWVYIKNIQKKYGSIKLTKYPYFSLPYLFYVNFIKGIRQVSLLNYIDYDYLKARNLLETELSWIYYGGKHHESTYTRWYQGYLLPKKFNIDKRYGHYADLIKSKSISRESALEELSISPYDENLQQKDCEYVMKKLNLSNQEFNEILTAKPQSFKNFRNTYNLVKFTKKVVNFLRKIKLYPK